MTSSFFLQSENCMSVAVKNRCHPQNCLSYAQFIAVKIWYHNFRAACTAFYTTSENYKYIIWFKSAWHYIWMVKLLTDSNKHAENNQTNKYGYRSKCVVDFMCLRKCFIQTVYLSKRFIDIIRLLKFKQKEHWNLLGYIAHTAKSYVC